MFRRIAIQAFLCASIFLSIGAAFGTVLPESDYKTPLGVSRWCVGKNSIAGNIGLNENLFSALKGINGKKYNYATGNERELQRVAKEFLQPYIDKKITVSINGTSHPVIVDRLVRQDNSIYLIWFSVKGVDFKKKVNDLKIEYRMLAEELGKNHINAGYLYKSEARGAELERLIDDTPALGQFDFIHQGPSWDLKIEGPST